MNALTRDDVATVLRLFLTKGIGPRTLSHILAYLGNHCIEPAFLSHTLDKGLIEDLRMSPDQIEAFNGNEEEAYSLLSELEFKNVHILVEGADGFPKRIARSLGSKCPPLLFAVGNLDLFKLPAVGFCGSRRASVGGLDVATECSSMLAKRGVNVVAGYAHGVDMSAHRAALESGGSTTLVLAEGITQFRMKTALQDVATLDNTLAISEFVPRIPWNATNAMQRNRTICALSSAMILVESGDNGGTFEAGKTALEIGCPLYVVEYVEPADSASGNQYFFEHGAHRLMRRKSTGLPNLESVLSTVTAEGSGIGGNRLVNGNLFN